MRKSNIYLVGFMGAGKTSVGMRLAELLHWDFIDLDREIEKREGRPIREIFRMEGESHFRRLERAELERVCRLESKVVALGGGTFVDGGNRETIGGSGVSVWLDASMDVLYPRCSGDPLRPLATSRGEMEQLLLSRRPHYEQATIRIEVDGLTIDELADRIRDELLTSRDAK
jgi:shikimate kinase